MFADLLKLVTDNAQDAVINNSSVPNEHNDAVTNHVTNGIIDGLKNHAASGSVGVEEVMKLVGGSGGNLNSNPVVNNMSSGLVDSLMKKFGLSVGAAGNIISTMLPVVISKFVGQTNDPKDQSFDFQKIFSHLTGGQSNGFDITTIIKQVTGGNGTGGFDLSRITDMFKGNNLNTSSKGGNGLFDNIKGRF